MRFKSTKYINELFDDKTDYAELCKKEFIIHINIIILKYTHTFNAIKSPKIRKQ